MSERCNFERHQFGRGKDEYILWGGVSCVMVTQMCHLDSPSGALAGLFHHRSSLFYPPMMGVWAVLGEGHLRRGGAVEKNKVLDNLFSKPQLILEHGEMHDKRITARSR